MKTLDIKTTLFREIEGLNARQLNEVYGMVQNYLNGKDDEEEWDSFSNPLKEKIITGLKQADSNNTKPLGQVIATVRKKYNLNV